MHVPASMAFLFPELAAVDVKSKARSANHLIKVVRHASVASATQWRSSFLLAESLTRVLRTKSDRGCAREVAGIIC